MRTAGGRRTAAARVVAVAVGVALVVQVQVPESARRSQFQPGRLQGYLAHNMRHQQVIRSPSLPGASTSASAFELWGRLEWRGE